MSEKIKLLCGIMPDDSADKYFITVELNDKGDGISFDNTLKGHRILKQVNVGEYKNNEPITEEWDIYSFIDGKFDKIIHEKWIDKGKDDVINGIIYRQVWEISTPKEIDEMLLNFNNFLLEHKDNLKSEIVRNKVNKIGIILHKLSIELDSKNEFDETFSNEEIELIEVILTKALKNKDFSTEEELNKILFRQEKRL